MDTDLIEMNPEPLFHHRASTLIALAVGLSMAFAGGWAAAPHDVHQPARPAPQAALAAAPSEHVHYRCVPHHPTLAGIAQQRLPATADAGEAWLWAQRHRRTTP